MAEVSTIHRFHIPTITYDDDDEEYPHSFAFDFDSLTDNFNFSPNSAPGSLDSDSGHSGLLADPNSFIVDEDQMNFVTDMFVTEDRVFTEDFGSDFDGLDSGDGLRVVGVGPDSGDIDDQNDDLGVNGFWNCLRIDDDEQRDLNDDFEWEEVNERGEERDYLSSVIDGIEEISVSSDNSNSDSIDEPVRNLEWEVLLAVNSIERSLEFDGNDDEIDHDALIGQFLENEGTLKGSPPTAKNVIENLPLVELKDKENNTACAVCKDEILVVEKVTELPCSHYYHLDCILPWLNIRNTCPVCRYELPTDDTDYERRKIGRRNGARAEVGNDFQVRYNFEIVP
ncbi:E3 ubiquitin-protein ligase CIP8-like [Lycium ferocissimum]|uniref:E3 ubiquitin-protein ligase CIP8-like n=1 Tax=Lycium ferocissimum TaxID=112874 RepID=UPI0028162D21|nr:E3 ubiquitin-protein ligase CIP8-like [Lycium ferocissimum]